MLKQYLIERSIPGVGSTGSEGFVKMAEKSNKVLRDLGNENIQWHESFVTDDKIYCVYSAKDENIVRKHAVDAGFPADKVTEIKKVLDPSSAHEGYKSQANGVNVDFS